jgi:hypothetical protein
MTWNASKRASHSQIRNFGVYKKQIKGGEDIEKKEIERIVNCISLKRLKRGERKEHVETDVT